MSVYCNIRISIEDYSYLCQVASENKATPEITAAGIIATTIQEYRDEARWADIQEERDLAAMCQDNALELQTACEF